VLDLAGALVLAGQPDQAIAVALRAAESVVATGHAQQVGGQLLCHAAEAAIGLGRWVQAREWLDRAAAGGLRGPRSLPLPLLSARLATAQGDLDAARRAIDRARRLVPPGSPPEAVRAIAETTAELAAVSAMARQREPEAVEHAFGGDQVRADDVLAGRLYAVALRIVADAAERARAQRRPGVVDALAGQVEDLLDRSRKLADLPDQSAYAAQCAAEAARAYADPEAPGYWRAALRAWEALGRPYESGYAGLRLAEAIARDAAGESPEPVLRTAWQVAERLGAVPLRREIEALARSHRLRLSTSGPDVPEPCSSTAEPSPVDQPLTKRELEVLHRIAAGESNGDIAAALYISTKTASVHVSNILRKLGAANRRDAARAARLLGL
jgi:DNA-binding CsgD family transcriptional regulator